MATTTGTTPTGNGAAGTGTAWDAHRAPELDLIADCVHCGFCLPTCPTYVLWGEEMDSPRGRIVLMKEGHEEISAPMVEHLDRCLGCMACVTACPSGVQYDRLIEQTRAQVERRHERTRRDRALRAMIFALFPYPRRLRLVRGPLPVKLCYAGPFFRYERPQAGRYRQLQQVGVEAIGVDDPALDAEVIAIAEWGRLRS